MKGFTFKTFNCIKIILLEHHLEGIVFFKKIACKISSNQEPFKKVGYINQ